MTRRGGRAGRAARLLVPLLLGAWTTAAGSAAPLGDPGAARGDGSAPRESLLFVVRLDQLDLSEGIPVFSEGTRYFLPLGELCRLLDLAVEVDAGRGYAAGFLIDEKKRFELDLKFRRVSLAGAASSFDDAAAFAESDDIYVDSALLESWLPLKLEVRFHDLLVKITATEKLPLQQRLERDKKLAAGAKARPPVDLPRFALPYRRLDGPFVDASLRYSKRGERGEGRLEYSLAATGDLLLLEANLFLYGSDEELTDARLTLGRKDPEGRLLGPLRAREVAFGDIFHPGLELAALPRSGPGFLISNFPLDQPSQFGRESFRGDLPPGWEAELYRGEELLAYVRSRDDGLYEFLDVPLLFGLNLFRVELYGPQGQRRTERRLRNVLDSLTPPGQLRYRLAGNDPGIRYFGPDRFEAGPRASLELSTGLARNVSASLSLASVDYRDRSTTFAEAGLRAFAGPLLASFDLAVDGDGGTALQGRLQSRWRRFGVELRHAQLDSFESERFVVPGEELRSRTWLRLDTVLPATFLPRLPLYLDLRQDRYASGRELDQVAFRVSAFLRGLSLTHQIALSRLTGDPSGGEILDGLPGGRAPARRTAVGQLLLSKYVARLALRGRADYELEPRAELTGLELTAEWERRDAWLLSGGVSRLFRSGENRYSAGVGRVEGPFGINAIVDYGRLGGFGLSLLLSMSFSRDSRTGHWQHQARPLAFGGGLSARAFLDENGNGLLDPGENGIAGAGLLVGGNNTRLRTDEQGELFLANLPPYQPLSLAISPGTLEDPYWQPAGPGVAILPRPGKVAVVDFPVEITGEITGTVYLELQGRSREAPGIELELVAADGRVAARARSAADGFYDLDRLRPGLYTLRIAEAQVARLKLTGPTHREVRLEPGGTILDNLDFQLVRGEI